MTLLSRALSEAIDNVVIDILVALATKSSLQQEICCVQSPMSGLLSAMLTFMT